MSKGLRNAALLTRIDALASSYLPKAEIKALNLPTHERFQLERAIQRYRTLSREDITALRGTDHGNAVAEGIEKARALDAMVPKVSGQSRGNPAGRLALEMGAASAGSLVAGPAGAAAGRLGAAALEALPRRSRTKARAQAAELLGSQAPRYRKALEKMDQSPPARSALDVLARRLKTEQQSAEANRQALRDRKAAEGAVRLADEARGRNLGVANDRDNIRPGGGYRGLIYERTGLLPQEQDAGALQLLSQGKIDPDSFQAFLSSPDRLMAGRGGLAIMDRLASLADEGTPPRDPKWQGPAAAPQDALGSTIRNPLAYAATAKANQQRVSDAISSVQAKDALSEDVKEMLSSTLSKLANTSDRQEAEAIVSSVIDQLPKASRTYARSVLRPVTEQIKPKAR